MHSTLIDATIVRIIDETDEVRRFFIKIPEQVPFHFLPGQFINLNLHIGSGYTNRSYSIASPPSNEQVIELCISLKPGGLGTPYIYEHFKVGASIKISYPLGKFRLPEIIDKDLCFICTGTGIAPLRSMILYIFNYQIPHHRIFLISGSRWEKTILYKKEMEDLTLQHPEFSFIPVLSRDNPGWKGCTGYVHAIYESLFKDKKPVDFYLCGWSDMLKEARKRLEALGYDKHSIHFETFN